MLDSVTWNQTSGLQSIQSEGQIPPDVQNQCNISNIICGVTESDGESAALLVPWDSYLIFWILFFDSILSDIYPNFIIFLFLWLWIKCHWPFVTTFLSSYLISVCIFWGRGWDFIFPVWPTVSKLSCMLYSYLVDPLNVGKTHVEVYMLQERLIIAQKRWKRKEHDCINSTAGLCFYKSATCVSVSLLQVDVIHQSDPRVFVYSTWTDTCPLLTVETSGSSILHLSPVASDGFCLPESGRVNLICSD